MLLFPRCEILAGKEIVRVLPCLGRHVDHNKRSYKRACWDFFRADPVLREMDWGIEMRARMLDDAPPIQIESVLLEIEFLLHLNSHHSEIGGKALRHGMGKIDH